MKVLPSSRPLTEQTLSTYQVVKFPIMRAYGRILEFLHLLTPQTYDEVLGLDMMLLEARANIPAYLQLGTLEEMKDDPASLIMERFVLQHFYHKAQIVLHRKFWDTVPTGTKGNFYSRKTCVSSALALLNHQTMMHHGCQPGGPLMRMKWYQWAITNHDWLLSAMVVCLDVMNIRKAVGPQDSIITETDKLSAIQTSRDVFAEVIDVSKDARRAVSILDAVLAKLAISKEEAQCKPEAFLPMPSCPNNPNPESLRFSPYFMDQFGLGASNIVPDTSNDVVMQDSLLDAIGSDLSIPSDFNWASLSTVFKILRTNFNDRMLGTNSYHINHNSNSIRTNNLVSNNNCCRSEDTLQVAAQNLLSPISTKKNSSSSHPEPLKNGPKSTPPSTHPHFCKSNRNFLLRPLIQLLNYSTHIVLQQHRFIGLLFTTLSLDKVILETDIQLRLHIRWH
jgi:hypothetical protein